eukprot:TRINITY_DN7955_c0_g1_i1.p1 TRINITY_DN7955_c0_g1~~TRINITY_DN7955_c0_g1_i1.p1  ORF type:complete len:723 (+),score=167.45 TRINITY_DN7955_c0_g1_i1:32-2200(+)
MQEDTPSFFQETESDPFPVTVHVHYPPSQPKTPPPLPSKKASMELMRLSQSYSSLPSSDKPTPPSHLPPLPAKRDSHYLSQSPSQPQYQTSHDSQSQPQLQSVSPLSESQTEVDQTKPNLFQKNPLKTMRNFSTKCTDQTHTYTKDDLETLFSAIQHDPRYCRMLQLWDPKLFSKAGLKKFSKNLIDPSHIPFFGDFVKVSRTRKLQKQSVSFKGFSAWNSSEALNEPIHAMNNGMKVEYTMRTANVVMSFFPLTMFLPVGLSTIPQALVLEGIKIGGAQASAATARQDLGDSAMAKANICYAATKGFLLYLGLPKTDDPLYTTWEKTRVELKEAYGADASEDLSETPPNEALVKLLDEMETEGLYRIDFLKVSLLYLLWWIYECWDAPYYNQLRGEKYRATKSTEFKNADEAFVRNHIRQTFDRKVIRLDETYTRKLVALFLGEYEGHLRFSGLDDGGMSEVPIDPLLRELKESPRVKKEWVVSNFVSAFVKKGAAWGLIDDYHRVLAAALITRSSEESETTPYSSPSVHLLNKSSAGSDILNNSSARLSTSTSTSTTPASTPASTLSESLKRGLTRSTSMGSGEKKKKKKPSTMSLRKIISSCPHARVKLGSSHTNYLAQLKWEDELLATWQSPEMSTLYLFAQNNSVPSSPVMGSEQPTEPEPLKRLLRELLKKHTSTLTLEFTGETTRLQLLQELGFSRLERRLDPDNVLLDAHALAF